MQTVIQDRYGSADVLTTSSIAIPHIAPDEVLIEVVAAGVDRGVWHLVTGKPYLVRLAGYGVTKPKNPVPGLDVSGRVVAICVGGGRLQVGDGGF
jgi:NADPH:quinone reductase-like Zn-dependent oxidoreductase